MIVGGAWLAANREHVLLADVRWYADGRSGAAGYRAGHLPGATYVDLDAALAAAPSQQLGRHPLPAPEEFALAMSDAGIGDDDLVVAYDDAGGVIAARLVWMLRATGHVAALLDGGIGAYGGPLEIGGGIRPPAVFTAPPWPAELLATADEVASPGGGVVVVDARPRERFAGEADALDPRGGHVPGARSLPCRELLGHTGALRPADELVTLANGVGISAGTPVIAYCGSGVTACHDLLVLEWLGLGRGRLFPGSWSQWSRDPDRAVETGPDRGTAGERPGTTAPG